MAKELLAAADKGAQAFRGPGRRAIVPLSTGVGAMERRVFRNLKKAYVAVDPRGLLSRSVILGSFLCGFASGPLSGEAKADVVRETSTGSERLLSLLALASNEPLVFLKREVVCVDVAALRVAHGLDEGGTRALLAERPSLQSGALEAALSRLSISQGDFAPLFPSLEGEEWRLPVRLGFELFEVDAACHAPVGDVESALLLSGDQRLRDRTAIEAVYGKQGFCRDDLDGTPSFHRTPGCGSWFSGAIYDYLTGADKDAPRIALVSDVLVMTRGSRSVTKLTALSRDSEGSFGDDPVVAAALRSMAGKGAGGQLIQFVIRTPRPSFSDFMVALRTMEESAPRQREAREAAEPRRTALFESQWVGELPPYRLHALGYRQDPDGPAFVIALGYQDRAEAEMAIETMARRLAIYTPYLGTDEANRRPAVVERDGLTLRHMVHGEAGAHIAVVTIKPAKADPEADQFIAKWFKYFGNNRSPIGPPSTR